MKVNIFPFVLYIVADDQSTELEPLSFEIEQSDDVPTLKRRLTMVNCYKIILKLGFHQLQLCVVFQLVFFLIGN